MGEEAQRGLVLLYIAVFCVLEAEMLRRQTRLGRAMAASRWAMATVCIFCSIGNIEGICLSWSCHIGFNINA